LVALLLGWNVSCVSSSGFVNWVLHVHNSGLHSCGLCVCGWMEWVMCFSQWWTCSGRQEDGGIGPLVVTCLITTSGLNQCCLDLPFFGEPPVWF
jgi:hypothetical protein